MPHLLSGYVAHLIPSSTTVNGQTRSGAGVSIYQVHGSVLSTVYGPAMSSAQTGLVIHAAQQSARNLADA